MGGGKGCPTVMTLVTHEGFDWYLLMAPDTSIHEPALVNGTDCADGRHPGDAIVVRFP